jgi:hypothetical protein
MHSENQDLHIFPDSFFTLSWYLSGDVFNIEFHQGNGILKYQKLQFTKFSKGQSDGDSLTRWFIFLNAYNRKQ